MSGSSIKVTFEKLVCLIQCLTFVVNAILNLYYTSHVHLEENVNETNLPSLM